jgi:hypothetical protein
MDCTDVAITTDGARCVRVSLDASSYVSVLDVVSAVSQRAGTSSENTICSRSSRAGEFNCTFFGTEAQSPYEVLLVGARYSDGENYLEISSTTSEIGPERFRELIEKAGPVVDLDDES